MKPRYNKWAQHNKPLHIAKDHRKTVFTIVFLATITPPRQTRQLEQHKISEEARFSGKPFDSVPSKHKVVPRCIIPQHFSHIF